MHQMFKYNLITEGDSTNAIAWTSNKKNHPQRFFFSGNKENFIRLRKEIQKIETSKECGLMELDQEKKMLQNNTFTKIYKNLVQILPCLNKEYSCPSLAKKTATPFAIQII